MSDETKAVARRLYEEVFEGGRLELADELVAEGARDVSDPRDRRGPGRVKEVATMLRASFPDQHWDIQHLLAEGDAVVMWSEWSGTHSGAPFMGAPATGAPFRARHVYRFQIVDGRVVEYEALRDDLALMRQLSRSSPSG